MWLVLFSVELGALRLLEVMPNLGHQKLLEFWCTCEKNLEFQSNCLFLSFFLHPTHSLMWSCSVLSSHPLNLGGPPPLTLDDHVSVVSTSYVLSLIITPAPSSLCVSTGHGLPLLMANSLAENYPDVLENSMGKRLNSPV